MEMNKIKDTLRAAKKENAFFHELFEIAVLLKGAFGVIELFLGAFILLVNRSAVSDFLLYLVHGELVEDPEGFLPTALHIFRRTFPRTRSRSSADIF